MSGKILVTPRSVTSSGHPALGELEAAGFQLVFCSPGEQPSQQQLMSLVPGCVGYLAGVEPVTAAVLEAARQLRVIARNGVGLDNIDLEAARRLKIKVLPALGANARAVAELAVGLMFSLARSIPSSDQAIKGGAWQRRKGMELEGKTLGVIGCGRVGRLVAAMVLGMGMKVLAYDIDPDLTLDLGVSFHFAPLEQVLRQSDVISLHCPPAADGKPVIDRDAFSRMRRGVLLINTARHDVVDSVALAEHIRNEHVAGAALDVFDREPPSDRTLVESDRVIATPHIGAFTGESVYRAVRTAVDNLLAALHRTGPGTGD